MPLSRHFYSLDEVQAALLYTTTRNTPIDALFWCQEMILSGCVGEAISTLFQSWLWNTGPTRLQWLIAAWKSLALNELSEDDILLSTYNLCSVHYQKRDTSLWNILVLTAQNPTMPDTLTRKTPKILPSESAEEIYFIRALYQGKARAAWWISLYIDRNRVWSLLNWYIDNILTLYKEEYKICLTALENYEKLLGYKSNEYDIIILCSAVIMLCIHPDIQSASFKPMNTEIDRDILQTLDKWTASIGRKERRIYQIPTSCLYGITLRGRSKWSHNNLTQLYNVESYLAGCPFWDEVLAEYATISENGEIIWISDDKMEEFYDKYFPDDIPDEWTKKDQLQSHGDGVLGPTDKPLISKYSRNHFSKYPYFAWNTTKDINNYLDSVDIKDCSLEGIVELIIPPVPLSEEDLKKLEPVHKIKVRQAL